MNISIGSLKRKASRSLHDYLGTAMLAVLTEAVITLGGSYLASAMFSGSDPVSIVLYQVFAFGVSLIASIFSAGLLFLFLNIARKKKAGVGNLFFFFKHHPDRVIVASFLLSLIQLVCMIPCYYYQFKAVPGKTPEEQLSYLMTFLVFLGGGQILYILLSMPFAQTYLLMADDLSLGGVAAMKQSAQLMRGAKYSYFLLLLSYAPMLILSVFLLYIPLIWVVPHLLMSQVLFYEKLRNPEMSLGEGFRHESPLSYVNNLLAEEESESEADVSNEKDGALESETGEKRDNILPEEVAEEKPLPRETAEELWEEVSPLERGESADQVPGQEEAQEQAPKAEG